MINKYNQFGILLFIQIFISYIFVSICFTMGYHLIKIAFPASIIIGYFATTLPYSFTQKNLLIGLLSIICWILTICISIPLIDYSFDGNIYHQEIIAAIYRGWDINNVELPGIEISIWANHYAKAIEMSETAIVGITGLIESGKAVNYIFGLSAGLIFYGFCIDCFPSLNRELRIIITLIAICNPIYLSQLPTYYIDYAKYFYTLLSIIYIIKISTNRSTYLDYLMLFAIICMAIGTKFNMFFEEGIVILASIIWLIIRKNYSLTKRLIVFAFLSTIIGALVLGYHPYFTNYIAKGHSLYPLLGEGKVDIMTSNTPVEYLGMNRFVSFFKSMTELSFPLVDQRKGGFGIFMLPMLCISTVVIWKKRHLWNYLGIYIYFWILISCFFFPQSWWARYICQIWIIIVLGTLIAAISIRESKLYKNSLWTLSIMTLITALLCISIGFKNSIRQTLYRNAILSEIKHKEINVISLKESFKQQLEENKSKPIPVNNPDTSRFKIPYYGNVYEPEFYPILIIDSITYTNIMRKLDNLPFNYNSYFYPDEQ